MREKNLPHLPHYLPHYLRLAVFGIALAFCKFVGAQPVDNPVASYYGDSAYGWTDSVNWSQTFNILDYGGDSSGVSANDAAYVAARDAAENAGGGVVYFPAGEYVFEDSIYLVDGVVLRGDPPSLVDSKTTGFRPPSKLSFPKFNFVASGSGTDPDSAFKGIGMSGAGINTGLVHLDINRASVFAGGYGSDSENVVIFGIRSNNVASEQPWSVPTSEQNDWQIHPNRFVANISAFAYRNVLVANCRVNDAHHWVHRERDGKDLTDAPADLASLEVDDFEQPGYLIQDGSVWKTVEQISGSPYVFEYTDHYGINVQGSTGEWGAPPWVQPNLFYAGAVIRDNWVYTTMRVKIDSSGRGLVIKDNELLDRAGKTRYVDPNGVKRVQNAATLENRGIDWRGHDVLIEGNNIEVRRHLLNGGPYSSVDGEAILHQEVHGSTIDGLTIRGNTANAYIGIWKMPYTRNVLIEDNTLISPGYIYVQSDTNGSDFPLYNTTIRNNFVDGGIIVRADYFSPGVMSANVYDNQLDGTLEIEDHGTYSSNTKQDGLTPASVDIKTGAVAIDPPAEGILFADSDPDELSAGETVNFTVLVTTPSVDVERVKFYRHKTLMATDENPPYTYEYTSDGSRGLWSAKVEQEEQPGGSDPYTALLVEADPAWSGTPSVILSAPNPAATFVAPATLDLSATVMAGSSPLDRVEFYAGGTYIGEGIAGSPDFTLSWTDVPLGSYSITAKVWDTAGTVVVSEPAIFEVSGAPDAAPVDLNAVAYSDHQIDLSWSDAASNSEEFEIQRSPSGAGAWVTVDSVSLPATTFRDSGLSSDSAYDYRILAINAYGSSDPSTIATESTLPSALELPGVPSGLKARAVNASAMKIDWVSGSGVPFGFIIESAPDANGPWSLVANVSGSVGTYLVSSFTPGERAYFRLRAWNNIGSSSWAQTSGATLSADISLPETFSADGLPWAIPGRIEFADYNPGGYYDTSSGNEGSSSYRFPDSVDMGGGSDNPTIGWIADGEWLDFSVRVDQAGLYDVTIGYSSPNTSGSLSLKLDGQNIAPPVTFASTGAWGSYQSHTISDVYLSAGHFILRSYVENSGFNLDDVDFSLKAGASYAVWAAALLDGQPDSAWSGNADQDSYGNIFEMMYGLDPLSPDAGQTSVSVSGGYGHFRFPIAKGLSLDWSVQQATDLGAAAPWSLVPVSSIEVISEETERIWMEAKVPSSPAGQAFFQIEVAP